MVTSEYILSSLRFSPELALDAALMPVSSLDLIMSLGGFPYMELILVDNLDRDRIFVVLCVMSEFFHKKYRFCVEFPELFKNIIKHRKFHP